VPLVETPTLISLKNILLATDFSEYSRTALTAAASFARQHGATLWLAHVVAAQPRLAIPIEAMPACLDAEWTAAEKDMASLGLSSLLQGVSYELLLERGELWPVLSDAIAKHDVDLIVVGTHGRGGISKLLLGSVAEEIVRLAPCPVLTVGPESFAKVVPQEALGQILYTTDFRPGSLAALSYALSLAQENHARLALLHVCEVRDDALNHTLRERTIHLLMDLIPPETRLDHIPEFLVECGVAADAILQMAAEKKTDLIVMGARQSRHSFALSHLAWPMTHRVLARAKCPVLTVRG
jgi:nucleotide-binding universal stress UspA family protein